MLKLACLGFSDANCDEMTEATMNEVALMIAALLLFGTGIVHSILGEHRLIGPLLDPNRRTGILEKSRFARQVLRFAWHLTTLALWGFAAILAGLAITPSGQHTVTTLAIIAVVCLLSAAYIFITSGARHLAWPIFLTASGLCVVPLI